MKDNEKRIKTIKNESGLYNINVDCNSKEGKMLIEVVEKEASLRKKKRQFLFFRKLNNFYYYVCYNLFILEVRL